MEGQSVMGHVLFFIFSIVPDPMIASAWITMNGEKYGVYHASPSGLPSCRLRSSSKNALCLRTCIQVHTAGPSINSEGKMVILSGHKSGLILRR